MFFPTKDKKSFYITYLYIYSRCLLFNVINARISSTYYYWTDSISLYVWNEVSFQRSQHILVESDITFKPLPDIAKMYFK